MSSGFAPSAAALRFRVRQEVTLPCIDCGQPAPRLKKRCDHCANQYAKSLAYRAGWARKLYAREKEALSAGDPAALARREARRAQQNARARKRRAKNRERVNELQRESYYRNREKALARCREHYERNREQVLQRSRERYAQKKQRTDGNARRKSA